MYSGWETYIKYGINIGDEFVCVCHQMRHALIKSNFVLFVRNALEYLFGAILWYKRHCCKFFFYRVTQRAN